MKSFFKEINNSMDHLTFAKKFPRAKNSSYNILTGA